MSESTSELPHLIPKRKVVKSGRYGLIPEFPVGTHFEDRKSMYNRGFHASLQAGIQGREATGACSVVLSGGYEDDVDLGYEL
ncbi:hypothetical protein CVT25_010819 [Psilocybe cyanescens]|uniref:YDG domain-containing protein n=1 Tax=Psilocybe cyanescens TaxID=93625 RepID=A0A409WF41_PSICY|nr:hypothetical protein CVT25_010819 [Psilocybe cyanescens]